MGRPSEENGALEYALSLLQSGILTIDPEGRIWRHANKNKGEWKPCPPRRAENVGNKGYLRVTLWMPDQRLASVMANRLVYIWLVGPIPDGMEIDHKDKDKTNNRPDNLEPVTGLENMRRSFAMGRTKPYTLTEPRVGRELREQIRQLRLDGRIYREIRDITGVSITHVQRICAEGRHGKGAT